MLFEGTAMPAFIPWMRSIETIDFTEDNVHGKALLGRRRPPEISPVMRKAEGGTESSQFF